jgi:hypothetical protein
MGKAMAKVAPAVCFNWPGHKIWIATPYVSTGDDDLEEGISSEFWARLCPSGGGTGMAYVVTKPQDCLHVVLGL